MQPGSERASRLQFQ